MSDESWLREGLADAVPEPPSAPDRADGARTRARRARRTTLAAVAGSAAAVVLVAGLVATLGHDRGSPDNTADGGGISPYDAAACPAEPVDTLTQVGPDHVPDGADSVRLCNSSGTPIDVPSDALVTRVDELAAAVNGLETAGTDMVCTNELGPGFQLVFAYPDGSTVVASGELYGCRQVVVDGVERVGAPVPWDRFISLLQTQREELGPPRRVDASAIDCSASTPTATVGRSQDLAAAAVCVESAPMSGSWRKVGISSDELAVLRTDLVANSRQESPRRSVSCIAAAPSVRIVGLTTWGDHVELLAECTLQRFETDARSHSVWTLGVDALSIVERLAG